jgi:hypothetical protein
MLAIETRNFVSKKLRKYFNYAKNVDINRMRYETLYIIERTAQMKARNVDLKGRTDEIDNEMNEKVEEERNTKLNGNYNNKSINLCHMEIKTLKRHET